MQAAGQTSRCVPRGSAQNARSDEPDQGRHASSYPDRRRVQASTKHVKTTEETADGTAISTELVQTALVTALQSKEFQSAPQLRAFLGFVVRATLDNEQEKLKGYTIAVEALGRPEDFNPVTDPIVRVEAARLRRRLEKYYAGSGADDPVRIIIPKGSYTPEFLTPDAPDRQEAASGGVLTFHEGAKAFEPEQPSGPEATGVEERALLGAAPEITSAPIGGSAQTALPGSQAAGELPLFQPGAFPGLLKRLAHRSVPLPLALGLGAFCLLAGYLLAQL